jgi:hypothetical protein
MTNGRDERAIGTGLAGGAIATALLEALFDKGLLSLGEAKTVLDEAMIGLATVGNAEGAIQARRIIATLQSGKFAERG